MSQNDAPGCGDCRCCKDWISFVKRRRKNIDILVAEVQSRLEDIVYELEEMAAAEKAESQD